MAPAPPHACTRQLARPQLQGEGTPNFVPQQKQDPPLLHHHLEQGSSPRLEQNLDSGDCRGTGLLRRDRGVTRSFTQRCDQPPLPPEPWAQPPDSSLRRCWSWAPLADEIHMAPGGRAGAFVPGRAAESRGVSPSPAQGSLGSPPPPAP